MNIQSTNDINGIIIKLNEIWEKCPEDYYYIKGWIHCLALIENQDESKFCKLSEARH